MRELPPLPRKVKGLVSDYRVAMERPVSDGAAAGFENDGNGNPIIRVSPNLSPPYMWQAFYHELIHAAEFEQGLNLPDTSKNPVVDKLALSLTGFWLRNRWVLPGE